MNFPSVEQLLRNYVAVLVAKLGEPASVEERDPYRLELQAVMHHLRTPK